MTIIRRKEREKQEMRRGIMDAAMDLFLNEGFDKVSIRGIAEIIEYSPATIYLYFKNKDDIFYSLLQEGFAKLYEKQMAVQDIADPLDRLAAHGRAYVEFAMENHKLYDIMFIMRGTIKQMKAEGDWKTPGSSYNLLRQNVRECMEAGCFPGEHPEVMAFRQWSLVHGASSLIVSGRLDMLPEDLSSLIIEGFKDSLLRLMKPREQQPASDKPADTGKQDNTETPGTANDTKHDCFLHPSKD